MKASRTQRKAIIAVPLLALLLLTLSSLAAEASQPTGLTLTPFGPKPSQCVHEVPNGSVVSSNQTSMRVVFPNGTVMIFPPCSYVPPSYTGWVENTYYSIPTGYSLEHYSSLWQVPGAPTSNDGQTIFLFIGSEDSAQDMIIQPVLQWGQCYSYGCAYNWQIDSYYCDSTNTCSRSPESNVNTGDQINGTINQSYNQCDRGNPYDIVATDTSTGAYSDLQTCAYPQTNVYVTLEMYNLQQCSDYPSSGSTTFGSIKLVDNFGNILSPSWGTSYGNALPSCNYNIAYSSSSITLYY
jgi:hypothetical protein